MFILGDSHANAMVAAARKDNTKVFGGMLSGGRHLNVQFYDRTPNDFAFRDAEVDSIYRRFLREAGISCITDLDMPVLCLFGMNIHYLSRADVWSGFAVDGSDNGRHLSGAVVRWTVRAMISEALKFYGDLVDMGCEVYSALPPRRSPAGTLNPVFRAIEDVLIGDLTAIGVDVVDHRSWSLDPEGHLRAELAHPEPLDDVHGSVEFGSILLQQIAETIHSKPHC